MHRTVKKTVMTMLATGLLVGTALPGASATEGRAPTDPEITRVDVDPQDTPELQSYLAGLSGPERAEFVRTRLVDEIIIERGQPQPANAEARQTVVQAEATDADVGVMATGCWTSRWTGSAQATAGNTLYTWYHVGGWCANGSTVTSAWEADSGGETSTPGWRYEGVVARDSGVVSNEGRSYSKHQFVLGVGGWDVQSPQECLRVRGFSNATATASYTCGIY